MITDIMLIIATVAGPIFIIMMALSYRWWYSFIPLAIFGVFWILWFILDTTVPFDWVTKESWFVITLVLCGIATAVGLGIRWYMKNYNCDPKIQECVF